MPFLFTTDMKTFCSKPSLRFSLNASDEVLGQCGGSRKLNRPTYS